MSILLIGLSNMDGSFRTYRTFTFIFVLLSAFFPTEGWVASVRRSILSNVYVRFISHTKFSFVLVLPFFWASVWLFRGAQWYLIYGATCLCMVLIFLGGSFSRTAYIDFFQGFKPVGVSQYCGKSVSLTVHTRFSGLIGICFPSLFEWNQGHFKPKRIFLYLDLSSRVTIVQRALLSSSNSKL